MAISTTSKPISLIYYGNESQIALSLQNFSSRIEYCHYLKHRGERRKLRVVLKGAAQEQSEGKAHYHVLIKFNGRVPLDLVNGVFIADDEGRSLVNQPRVCRSVPDWILYCSHIDDYIVELKRGEPKPTKYGWGSFCSTDLNRLQTDINDALDWLDVQLQASRRRGEVQALGADLSRPWSQVLALCRNPNEEMVAYRYRQAVIAERRAAMLNTGSFQNALKRAVEPSEAEQW